MVNIKVRTLQRFVANYPEKAVDVLMRCCHDQDIEKEITQFLLEPDQEPKNMTRNTLDTTNISSVPPTLGPSTPPSSHPGSHRSESFSDHRRTPRGTHTALRNKADVSPSRSSNYSKSITSKSGKEDILITAMTEDDEITKEHARMRSAQITYSVIGEHIFSEGRICRSNIKEDVSEQLIPLPCRGASGTFRNVPVSSYAKLTWRRLSSDATHKTFFYVVPQDLLDIDVLLGTRDSGEDIMPSYPHKVTGLNFHEYEPKGSVHMANAHSFHRSSHINDGSNAYPDEVLQTMMRAQRNLVPSQRGSGSNPSNNVQSHQSHSSSTSNPAPSAPPVFTNSQSDRIRLDCQVGTKELGIWLDLDDHADAFLANIDAAFKKRRLTFVQTNTTILLKADLNISDEEAYHLILDEEELEPDWAKTLRWLRAKRNATLPHIFGTIQIGND